MLAHHGTPSSARRSSRTPKPAAARGLPFRSRTAPPGTSRRRGRRVGRSQTARADGGLIADALGAERFYTIVVVRRAVRTLRSGPARRSSDRVLACAVSAGVAPFDADGLDWAAGMAPRTSRRRVVALVEEDAIVPYLERMAASPRPAVRPAGQRGETSIPTSTSEALAVRSAARHRMLEESVSTGLAGWIDDDVALPRPGVRPRRHGAR